MFTNPFKTSLLLLVFYAVGFAQQNKINIVAELNTQNKTLNIQQEITYYNNSEESLNEILLHNWPNSFKDRKTPLSKRFIKDFKKDLYFAKPENLGLTVIKNIAIDFNTVLYEELENNADVLKVFLKKPLQPKEHKTIKLTYIVKLPNAKFTRYGFSKENFNLRYWYFTPVIYNNGWQYMSNLNLDDLYEDFTTFDIEFTAPKNYKFISSLQQVSETNAAQNTYLLEGKNERDVIIYIQKEDDFKTFSTDKHTVETNIFDKEINEKITKDILNRELRFLEQYLGKLPIEKVFIDEVMRKKNPVYGLNQLPKFIRPFSDVFKYDLILFKVLSKRYIRKSLLLNARKDYWILDGLQNYLMIEYVNKFYPEVKLLGTFSNSWFLKNYNISKLQFNEKYPFVYQFTARRFLDQSLTTSADSLSNFNRTIASNYKAGLSFTYLKGFLGDSILKKSIKEFYQKNKNQTANSKDFEKLLSNNTSKNLDWFFNDYISTNKKIDYTIKAVKKEKDSLTVVIKNKRNITAPVAFYGLKNKEVIFKKWLTDINDEGSYTISKDNIDEVALNHENIYPEYNTLDNYFNLNKKLFNKPLKFTLIKDVKAPDYNQIFYEPTASYNFYDGLILGFKVNNKPLIKRNLELNLSPGFALKSQKVNGSFSILYNQFFEKTKIYKITYGLVGNTLQYAPDLSYSSLIPFVDVVFKRKTLRDASSEILRAKVISINREISPLEVRTEEDNYSVLSLSYNYIDPDIIDETRYNFSTEFAKNFSKVSADIRFRKLTSSNTQLDFRVFAGAFLFNNTQDDYFSFGLDRANDYLFELNYFGRSESSGIFSQQYIIAEGGFKSVLPTRFANQYMLALNSSIGLWRWVEFYNDIAFLKNRNKPVFFGYENGIRFNFVHNIFEIYFPLYSNNGWEVAQQSYAEKIRFTFTGDLGRVFNFFRRGFI
ncbi:aminopeptidase [uncultured Polaribacter sp.]|uniref:aminopeptidase n=1 Tax=uncultured Polaribacter sp. TaxID=174711 RepID=UPI00263578A3|nr:aminopeptidase [uncultured Polaribacter sp.]